MFQLSLTALSLTILLILIQQPKITTAIRDVTALTSWAKSHGVYLHPKLKWKCYGSDDDWGLVLTERVERGTVLMKVPRGLVLDASVLREENQRVRKDCVEVLKEALGEFALHEENFWIVLQLYRCRRCQLRRQTDHPLYKFAPWLDAMPTTFPPFYSPEELECLPFYAKYAAQYQTKKFQSFCEAAAALHEEGFDASDPEEVSTFKWAFQAVNSRFWKTNIPESAKERGLSPSWGKRLTSELVPLGDMMNHRDPPNVQMVPEDVDQVSFAYMGDTEDNDDDDNNEKEYERDLYLTYGQPCNPHRFLVVFGFVPNAQSMPRVWSHLAYPDANPHGNQKELDKLVFDARDGTIPQQVRDAVLWELWEPSSEEQFEKGKEAYHKKYKNLVDSVLVTHVTKQLEELESLRPKIETTVGPNVALMKRHNEFLTEVFTKVKNHLKG